jgi:hypothetical protein
LTRGFDCYQFAVARLLSLGVPVFVAEIEDQLMQDYHADEEDSSDSS